MAPAVEVLFAPAKEAYRNDPSTLHPVLDIVGASKGSLGIYHGVALEDPNQLFLVVVWETLADHQALIDDKALYPKLKEAFDKAGDLSQGSLVHVYFTPEDKLSAVLNAPYTAYAHVLTRKADTNAAELDALLKELTELSGFEGSHGAICGNAVEKDEHLLISGWDDPANHVAMGKRDPPASTLAKVMAIVDKHKRGHVKFNVYRKY